MDKVNKNRKLAIPALIAAGALSLTTLAGVALAQETEADTTDSNVTVEAPFDRSGALDDLVAEGQITQEQADAIGERLAANRGFGRGHARGGHFGVDVAGVLGLDATELREALAGGATVAELAAEQGLSVDDVVAAATADGFTCIDEQLASGDIDAERAAELKAQITERVTAHVNGEIPLRGAFGGRSFGFGVDVAEMLGMDTDELRTAIEGGSTIADLAVEQGLTVDSVIDDLTAAAYERIDEKVVDGSIDADQAAQMKTDVAERVTAMVNGEAPLGGGGPGGGGRGGPGNHGHGPQGSGGPRGLAEDGATGQGVFFGGGTSA